MRELTTKDEISEWMTVELRKVRGLRAVINPI